MASRSVLLKDLKVADLKKILEERDCDTDGKKSVLQQRLQSILEEEGVDPDTHVFNIDGDMNSLFSNLELRMLENSTNLESKIMESLMENSGKLETKMLDLKTELIDSSRHLEEKLENKLLETRQKLDKKIEEIERRFATFNSGIGISQPVGESQPVAESQPVGESQPVAESQPVSSPGLPCHPRGTRALEFEAAQQSARGQARVRQIEESAEEESMDGAIRRIMKETLPTEQDRSGHAQGHSRSVGKLNQVDVKGQSSAGHQHAPRKVAQVASLEHQLNSVFIDGVMNNKLRSLLLDTGATKTIIRPNMLEASTKIRPTQWRLRTATGHSATIHGEAEVTFTIGNNSFNHRVLVADIEDEVILGVDIMNSKGFQLDFEHGVLKINEEEVVLHGRTEERVRVILAEDTSIAERCEEIINGYPDGRFDDGRIMMLEPGTHDSDVGHGVVIGKSLIHVAEMVPVIVMNVNYQSVVLRKGTVLGYCYPVTSIVRRVNIAGVIPNQKISPELETLFETSAIGLKKDQKI
ncbi:hypothetical protein NQ315_012800, partial [Exocentrus adspersus]